MKSALQKIFRFLTVLKKGESLQDPAFWKKLAMLLTTLAGVAPIFAPLYSPLEAFLQDGGFEKLISAVTALNVYFQAATSEKVGY